MCQNPKIRKELVNKMTADLSELQELLHGMLLLGEVTITFFDYLISFGRKISINLVAAALNDLGAKQ